MNIILFLIGLGIGVSIYRLISNLSGTKSFSLLDIEEGIRLKELNKLRADQTAFQDRMDQLHRLKSIYVEIETLSKDPTGLKAEVDALKDEIQALKGV